MFSLHEVEAHIDDLNRQAAQWRLAHQSRNAQPKIIVVQATADRLGQALIWLGSRLHEPVREPVKPVVVSSGNPTLCLSEAVCC